MAKVSISTLIEAGVHFGHQTRRWNPKMKPYIFGSRGDIYIIDLKQTLEGMDRAYSFVSQIAGKGATILFVGTKKQAQEAISDAANRCGMPYVNARWLGGMLTNFATIRTRVDYMEELEAMEAEGRIDLLPKKEQMRLRKTLSKLQVNLNGIRNMVKLPDAVFIVDTNREDIAVREACRLNIPIVGILDTNCDPDDIEYGIPANDDAIRSVSLLVNFIADAVVAGTGANVTPEEMEGQTDDASAEEDTGIPTEETSEGDDVVVEEVAVFGTPDADENTVGADATEIVEEIEAVPSDDEQTLENIAEQSAEDAAEQIIDESSEEETREADA